MKFCQKCGKELHDDAVVCMGCGCAVSSSQAQSTSQSVSTANKSYESQIPTMDYDFYHDYTVANTLGIISIILGAVGIAIAWVLAILGYLFGGAGLTLAIISINKGYFSTKGKVGLVLSIITLSCSLVNSLIGFILGFLMFM